MSAHEAPEPAPSPPTGFKPHQLAIWLGIGIAVFIVISGVLPLITGWHNDNAIHREVFGGVPGPLQVAFYTVVPVVIVWASLPVRRADEELGARPSGANPAYDVEQRQAPLRRLPRRRVHAHPAARPGRRADALDDLLRVPRAAGRDNRAGDRPPAAREPQVPPRPHLSGVRLRRRPRRARVRRRRGVGDRPPLRRPSVPHPHQDPPGARRDPRRAARHRPHRIRRRDVPHRRSDTRR